MPTKILVVDDNPDGLELLEALLTLEGFAVVSAEGGRQALNLARTELPQLIITDIRMPGLNGIELIRLLRNLPEFATRPIIALTANVEAKSDAAEAGANSVLIKPVLVDTLLNTVASLLNG
ncbi:MAG TPA: response regulator [Blastocatellia bacterium]|nr:response regulator [Blastocatellia bacterium]